jgi:hypothetical protein
MILLNDAGFEGTKDDQVLFACACSFSFHASLDGGAVPAGQLPGAARHWVVAVDETEDSMAACKWMLEVLHQKGRPFGAALTLKAMNKRMQHCVLRIAAARAGFSLS